MWYSALWLKCCRIHRYVAAPNVQRNNLGKNLSPKLCLPGSMQKIIAEPGENAFRFINDTVGAALIQSLILFSMRPCFFYSPESKVGRDSNINQFWFILDETNNFFWRLVLLQSALKTSSTMYPSSLFSTMWPAFRNIIFISRMHSDSSGISVETWNLKVVTNEKGGAVGDVLTIIC
jgi:hypothetical protein